MNNLQSYKIAVNSLLVSGSFELTQTLDEKRTVGFDEYLDATNTIFKDCIVNNITMTSSNFNGCTFDNCIFQGGSIIGCVFKTCNIISLTFRDVDNSFSFIDCKIQELHFENGWRKL